MLIHSSAAIPLRATSLVEALGEFARFVQQHLSAGPGAELSIAIGETGARANDILARSLPDDAKEFGVGRLSVGPSLTAAQFRNAIASAKPKKTRSQVRVSAAAIPDVFVLLDKLSAGLPPSGRGIMLLVHLPGWKMTGDVTAVVPGVSHPEVTAPLAVDVTFSRFRHGSHDISATAGLRFHALSLKDPVVAPTIAAATAQTGLRFGKPMEGFAALADQKSTPELPEGADPRLQPPSPEAQLIVLLSFEEAIARAAGQIGARTEDLAGIPLLFSRSGGFDKRMRDVMAKKKESVNLPSRLKRFMKDRLHEYTFDAADPEQLWFRKSIAPTLDLLLMFDKVHQWGLGKTFSVDVAADFPNTPFGGMHTGWGGTRKNIFWMFHEGWEKQVWAYTTDNELTTALDGCGALLARILPAVEEHCRRLLLPVPSTLPEGIAELGALSAREALAVVLPMAHARAADIELESVNSSSLIAFRGGTGSANSSISPDGRLRRQGSWGFKFLSKLLDRYCYYVVPHTGRVWWNFYPVLQGAIPKYSSVIETDDWIDSTLVAPLAAHAAEQQFGRNQAYEISLALRDPQRYSGKYVWEASYIPYGAPMSERHTIIVQLDARSGAILETIAR
jgi:hypothetical protein